MQSQEPRAMQGPRARAKVFWTKSQRPRVTRTMSQGACRSHIMHQEPTSKSQGPRDQPTILQYSGLPPTDFLKQILIMQKMHAPNIFFAKIPQCGRLHACLTPSKNIPIVYTDLCNVWSGSSSCLHGNTMKPNVQAAGYIYIYIYGNASRTFEQLAKKWWCSETPMD